MRAPYRVLQRMGNRYSALRYRGGAGTLTPVEEKLPFSQAPDVMVVLGVEKKDRGSYKQWEEGNIVPQVAIEIVSPSNTTGEMNDKFEFYDHYGVEEYYVYDLELNQLQGWLRSGGEINRNSSNGGLEKSFIGSE
ncbi:MAG TPA: hypothetical protein DD761_13145, partial [Cyanobacteria bacterium UBA11691]|nr:hypothetical protein [Cyanobacteria bacterium UBA11691]